MLPVDGKPLLRYWLELLENHDINDVLINLHHLPDTVKWYVADFASSHPDFRPTLFYEEELLGSAGTIGANDRWIRDEKEFVIAYADNLTNADLTKLVESHRDKDTVLTMGLFHSDSPGECGIATLDSSGLIVEFAEKPKRPRSDLANAGMYVASPKLLDYVPRGFSDLGHDVLPKLVGKMYGDEIEGYLRDIGTLESYKRAEREWKKLRLPGRGGRCG